MEDKWIIVVKMLLGQGAGIMVETFVFIDQIEAFKTRDKIESMLSEHLNPPPARAHNPACMKMEVTAGAKGRVTIAAAPLMVAYSVRIFEANGDENHSEPWKG